MDINKNKKMSFEKFNKAQLLLIKGGDYLCGVGRHWTTRPDKKGHAIPGCAKGE